MVRALYQYRRGQGSSPGKPGFFVFVRLSFRNCISCIASLTARIFSTFKLFKVQHLGKEICQDRSFFKS